MTQKRIALYKLMQEKTDRYIPAHEFVGEVFLEKFNSWEFMSYKCPARLSDLYYERDDIDRVRITGKSGAEYFAYKFIRASFTGEDNV